MILNTGDMWEPTNKFRSVIQHVISGKHVDVYEEVPQQLWQRHIGYYNLPNNIREQVYEYWWRNTPAEEE